MSESRITVSYARALFLAARDQEVLDKTRYDAELLLEITTDSAEVRQLLESPVINSSKKLQVFHSLFSGRVGNLTLEFLKLVTENRREEYIPGMCRHFINLYKQERGILQANIATAVPLSERTREEVISIVREAFKAKIELNEQVNENLIGGFVIRVEDRQLDASVRGKLRKIKKELQA